MDAAPTRGEIIAELLAVNYQAKRCVPVVGWVDATGLWHWTAYDAAHDHIDMLLEDLDEASA